MAYVTFKRRKKKLTDYRQRLAMVKSGKTRIVVRRGIRNIKIQFIKFNRDGDVIVTEQISKNLAKYGWNCHNANLPAAYLTGYLAGAQALSKGVTDAVVDIGLQNSVKSSSLYCAVLGAKDAGIKINIGKEVMPPKDRVNGKHIADYAAKIKNTPTYQKQFSSYLKKGIDPQKLNEMFEHTKKEIAQQNNIKNAPAKGE